MTGIIRFFYSLIRSFFSENIIQYGSGRKTAQIFPTIFFMKEILIAKRIDFWLQILALLLPFIWAIAANQFFIMFFAYISVGSVQVLSCVLNKIGWQPKLKHDGRSKYEQLLLYVLIIMPLVWLVPAVTGIRWVNHIAMCIGILLPLLSPFMAMWYLSMTWEELVLVRRLSVRRVI